jgi:hypothetical protein
LQLNGEAVKKGLGSTTLCSFKKELDSFIGRGMGTVEESLGFGVSFRMIIDPIKNDFLHREYEVSKAIVWRFGKTWFCD